MTGDFAIAQESSGEITLHRADCSHVRMLAATGQPVMTMLDCQNGMSKIEIVRHSCLMGKKK